MSERPSSLILKPRRFRVTLWLLDDNLEPQEEIDEVKSCSCSYSLNQIPYAHVEPAHGINIKNGDPSKIIEKLDELIDKKAPVGICVERNPDDFFATISVTNQDDEDAEKWPKEKVFIFKGYMSSAGANKTGTRISTTIQLTHWLQDLATVSAYSPRAHISTPSQFAADMCRTGIDNPESTLGGWSLTDYQLLKNVFNSVRAGIDSNAAPEEQTNTMFDCVIAALRSILKTALSNMDKCTLGKVERSYFDKQDKALKRLRSCLAYKKEVRAALSACWVQLAASLEQGSVAAWANATCWDKILAYAATYYYVICPTAAWAYVIPTPACIPDTHIDIVQDEILNLYTKTPVAPVLGAVALATDEKERDSSYGTVVQYNPIIYPPQGTSIDELKDSVGGPIAITRAPSYLNRLTARNPPDEIIKLEINTVDKITIRPKMEEARNNVKTEQEAQKLLLYELVRLEFLSQVFAGRYASITTGFRGDIVPGACVHIHVTPVVKNNKTEKDINLYGTVSYVSLQIDSQGSAQTEFSITNIRNEKEYKHNIYNPDLVPFYNEPFDGTKSTIYCPFK